MKLVRRGRVTVVVVSEVVVSACRAGFDLRYPQCENSKRGRPEAWRALAGRGCVGVAVRASCQPRSTRGRRQPPCVQLQS